MGLRWVWRRDGDVPRGEGEGSEAGPICLYLTCLVWRLTSHWESCARKLILCRRFAPDRSSGPGKAASRAATEADAGADGDDASADAALMSDPTSATSKAGAQGSPPSPALPLLAIPHPPTLQARPRRCSELNMPKAQKRHRPIWIGASSKLASSSDGDTMLGQVAHQGG